MEFEGLLKELIEAGIEGSPESVDILMNNLNRKTSFAATKFIDYALSFVVKREGIQRIEYYLFNGSLIQRNYASLYFNRAGNWKVVKRAFGQGLIDEIQAYAR